MTDRYPAIDWRGVRGLGDVLRHDYERIDAEILTEKLPELAPVIGRMIDNLEQ